MRALMVGGGCRGLALAAQVIADGHAVRAVTRDESGRAAIEASGAECVIGDPDRIGTLRYALDNVTVLLWLLGTASGDPEQVRALHDTRLEFMLERTIDTTVRGVVYEAAGSVSPDVLAIGEAHVKRLCGRNEIPLVVVRADPAQRVAWLGEVGAAIETLLHTDRLGLRPGRGPAAARGSEPSHPR
jgi:uncharacterized protein YbjT (DUF2867 family)